MKISKEIKDCYSEVKMETIGNLTEYAQKLEKERDDQTKFAKEWKDDYFKLLDKLQALKDTVRKYIKLIEESTSSDDTDEWYANRDIIFSNLKSLTK